MWQWQLSLDSTVLKGNRGNAEELEDRKSN